MDLQLALDHAGPEWRETLLQWKQESRLCRRCGLTYKELENQGTWRCSQHDEFATNNGFTWSCCGGPVRHSTSAVVKACRRADHTILPVDWRMEHDFYLPRGLLSFFHKPRPQAVLTGGDLGGAEGHGFATDAQLHEYLVVRRYEWTH